MATKPTAPTTYTTVDPYKQYETAYKAQQNAVTAANTAQEQAKQLREQEAQKTLASSNRNTYTSYQRANSPQNKFQQQNNFSSGVSDYLKGANYSTYLKGLGANQQNYATAMNNSNTLWNNWLAEKASQEASNAGDYADKLANQSNADRTFNYNKYRDDMSDYQWQTNYDRNVYESDRDYNYQKSRDAVSDAQWQKTYDYNKSVDDRNYNYQVGRDAVSDAQWEKQFNATYNNSSGSGSGGSSSRYYSPDSDGYEPTDNGWLGDYLSATKAAYANDYSSNYTTKGAQNNSKSTYAVSTSYQPSSISGKQYKIVKYSDGSTKKILVSTKPTVTNRNGVATVTNSKRSSTGYAKSSK